MRVLKLIAMLFLLPLCGNAQLAYSHPEARADLERHYADQHSAFAATVERFKTSGVLTREDGDPLYAVEFVEQLGGEVDGCANWVEAVEFPMHIVELDPDRGDSNVYPRAQHITGFSTWQAFRAGITGRPAQT